MNCLLLCLIFYLPSAGDYFEQGNRYYEKHQYSEAIRVYEIAVELEPENGLSWAALGSAFGENREYEKALEEALIFFEAAAKNQSQEPAIHLNLGIVYLTLDEPEKAKEVFRKVIEIEPVKY